MAARIYTRTGDDGSTGLVDGSRVPKHDLRVSTTGTVDETSAAVGLALVQGRSHGLSPASAERLAQIQNDLFDVGADVSMPLAPSNTGKELRLDESYVLRLERWIDEVTVKLTPLENFVLPGGSPAAAALHLARTICRRAERLLTELTQREPESVSQVPLRYMNRLSDLFFVMARQSNEDGRGDVLWRPGGGREASRHE